MRSGEALAGFRLLIDAPSAVLKSEHARQIEPAFRRYFGYRAEAVARDLNELFRAGRMSASPQTMKQVAQPIGLQLALPEAHALVSEFEKHIDHRQHALNQRENSADFFGTAYGQSFALPLRRGRWGLQSQSASHFALYPLADVGRRRANLVGTDGYADDLCTS
jgi:hypothetical protein